MYKIVLRVPETIFFILIFLPVFLVLGGYYPDDFTGTILLMIGFLTGVLWMMGVSSYMDIAAGKKENDWLFYAALALFSVAALNEIWQNFTDQPLLYNAEWPMPYFSLVFDLIAGIWLTVKIKRVFYARSRWFIFFEVVCYAVGIATLTPEIKNHYRENRRKMDKAFAGGQDDNILV